MTLHKINEVGDRNMEAVIEALLDMHREEGVDAFLCIAVGRNGRRRRVECVAGRFRTDPLVAIGHLTLLKSKLSRWLARQSGFSDTVL